MNTTDRPRIDATDLLKILLTHQQIPPGVLATGGAHTAAWCADFIDEMAKRLRQVKSGG